MGIRELLNRYPGITTGATLTVIAVAVGFIIYSQWPGKGHKPMTESFYTTDDGATWFVDDIKKVPPFEKDGKIAVRAHVFRCGNEKPFVAFLERFNPDYKAKLEELKARMPTSGPAVGPMPEMIGIMQMGIQFKKPGDAKWASMEDDMPEFGNTMSFSCKDPKQVPERVFP